MTEDEQKRQEYIEQLHHDRLVAMVEVLKKAREGQEQLVDWDMPLHELAPDKEYIFPGHSHTHHPGPGEQHYLGSDHPIFNKPRDRNNKTGNIRKLLRQYAVIEFRGKRRCVYAMIWRMGHGADVYHTCPKSQWTEEEAKSFYGQTVAHPTWTAKKPTWDEFHAMLKTKLKEEAAAYHKLHGKPFTH